MKHLVAIGRTLLVATGLLLLWLALAWQPLTRMGIEAALQGQGFPHARVGRVTGNPLIGWIEIEDIRLDKSQYLHRAGLHLSLRSALQGRVEIGQVRLRGGALNLSFSEDALIWGPFRVPFRGKETTAQPRLPPVSLHSLQMENIRLRLRPGQASQLLHINHVRLAHIRLPFEGARPFEADWDLRWAGSRLSGEVEVDPTAWRVHGFVGVHDLSAGLLEPLVPIVLRRPAVPWPFDTLSQYWRFELQGPDVRQFRARGSGIVTGAHLDDQRLERLELKGTLQGSRSASTLKVDFKGALAGRGVHTPQATLVQVSLRQGSLQWQQQGERSRLSLQGQLALMGLVARNATARIHLQSLKAAPFSLRFERHPDRMMRLKLAGALQGNDLTIQHAHGDLKAADFTLKGGVPDFLQIEISADEEQPPRVALQGVSGRFGELKGRWRALDAQLAAVTLSEFSFLEERASWDGVTVKNATLRQDTDRLLLSSLALEAGEAHLPQHTLRMGPITADGMLLQWHQPAGEKEHGDSAAATGAVADADRPSSAAPWAVSLQALRLRNAVLDLHFRPPAPARERLLVRRMALTGFSTTSDHPATFVLDAARPPFGKINAKGTLQLNPQRKLQGTLSARDLDLTPWAGAIRALLDVGIKSGTLSVDAKGGLEGSRLDVDTWLTLHGVMFADSNGARAPAPSVDPLDSSQAGGDTLALQQALALLEEDDGIIRLHLPISGNLDDPQFHFADVFRILFTKAVQQAAITGLAQLLQPYGAYLTVGKFIYDQLTAIRLDPVLFEPGSTRLKTPSDYLDKLAQLMVKKPKLVVKLCGQPARADLRALQMEKKAGGQKGVSPVRLRALVRQRQVRVKQGILARAPALDSARLVLCRPGSEPADTPPRIELLAQ